MATERRTDPQGYEIVLTDERWEHVTDRHPEMKEHRDLVLLTIEQPELITRDREIPETFYYYRLSRRSILKKNDIYITNVIKREDGNKIGAVKTSHLVKKPKEGVLVWFKPQTK